jgi:chemotaxis protein MotB
MALKLGDEKPPNHERWIISYADFTTLLLATFVVMYAVSSINSSKFQEMAEAFSTAFIGRTVSIKDSGFSAAEKSLFTQMPSPVHLPVITRERQVKNLPPALRQEEVQAPQDQKSEQEGKYGPPQGYADDLKGPAAGGAANGTTASGSTSPAGAAATLRQQVEQRVRSLDEAYERLTQALSTLIGKGQVRVSLQSLGVVIDINEVLLFDSGKAQLTAPALVLVDQVAAILKDLHYQIQVNGFTDNAPIHNQQFDSNWDLAANRAIAVVKRFVASGIDPTLLVGAGFGEYHPVATNANVEGRAMNRRVSIVVVSPLEGSDPARTRMLGSAQERSGGPPVSSPPQPAASGPAPPGP